MSATPNTCTEIVNRTVFETITATINNNLVFIFKSFSLDNTITAWQNTFGFYGFVGIVTLSLALALGVYAQSNTISQQGLRYHYLNIATCFTILILGVSLQYVIFIPDGYVSMSTPQTVFNYMPTSTSISTVTSTITEAVTVTSIVSTIICSILVSTILFTVCKSITVGSEIIVATGIPMAA